MCKQMFFFPDNKNFNKLLTIFRFFNFLQIKLDGFKIFELLDPGLEKIKVLFLSCKKYIGTERNGSNKLIWIWNPNGYMSLNTLPRACTSNYFTISGQSCKADHA